MFALIKTNKPIKMTLSPETLCRPPSENNNFLFRYNFHTRVQLPDETIDQFVCNLWKLGSKCHFSCDGNVIEALVRDRFVVGLHDRKAQEQLLALSNKSQDFVKLENAISYLNEHHKDIVVNKRERLDSAVKVEVFDKNENDGVEKDKDQHVECVSPPYPEVELIHTQKWLPMT